MHPDVAAQPDLTGEPGDRPADSDGTGTVTGAVRRTWRPGRPLRPSRPPRRRRWSRGLAPTALPPTAVSRTAVPSTLVPSSVPPSGGAPSAAQVFPEAARPLTPRPLTPRPPRPAPPSTGTASTRPLATGPTRGTEDTGPERAPTGSSAAAGPPGGAAVGAPGTPRALGSPAVRPGAFGSGSLWARSLQLRVVTATLLVSVILVGVAGWFVLRQVSAGLVANREASAVGESTVGLNRAQALLADSAPGDPSRLITDLAQTLATQGATGPAGLFDVVVLASSGPTASTGEGTPDATQQYAPRASRDVLPDSVPPALRNAVRGTDDVVWGLGPISYSGGRQPEPGVIAGGEISTADAGTFDVFYLYSMADQVRTLGLLRRNIALAGTFLVVLLAAVAATVTRQVVRPVRAAAGIAERYASGNLTERMQVTGVDDIARLADTFNKMATALEDQFLRLEDLSRVQRRFVSDVSHELRTPLTTVRMAADMLFDDRAELPPQMVRSTELLQDQLDRFESLLVDLLEISRFDAGAAALAAAPTDLRPLVNAAVEAVGPLAAAHGCPLLVHAPLQPVTAEVDPRRITRILRNLLANAVDHSEGLPVEVTVAGDDRVAAIVVRDHGVGLSAAEIERVFDRFWRADPARARTTGGTGLGLSISAEDAALHGGRLQVWGVPAGGASFRLLLPVRVDGPLPTQPLPLVPPDARPGSGVGGSAGAAAADGAVPTGRDVTVGAADGRPR